MEKTELDALRDGYKAAVEKWIATIRAEEDLATADHKIPAIDAWEHASFAEDDARSAAKEAKTAYEDALRQVNFNF